MSEDHANSCSWWTTGLRVCNCKAKPVSGEEWILQAVGRCLCGDPAPPPGACQVSDRITKIAEHQAKALAALFDLSESQERDIYFAVVHSLHETVKSERRAVIRMLRNRTINARQMAAKLAPRREADEWHIGARALERVADGLADLDARDADYPRH